MDKKILLFDFDKTLYRKDSFLQFHWYCIKQNPVLVWAIPFQAIGFILYTIRLINTQQFKNSYLLFLAFTNATTIRKRATRFWQKEYPINFNHQLLELLNNPVNQCVIITASPTLLIEPLLTMMPKVELIGTKLARQNGVYLIDGKNCKGAEKVSRFQKRFGESIKVHAAYSDHRSDLPMLSLAKEAYLIKNRQMIRLQHSELQNQN